LEIEIRRQKMTEEKVKETLPYSDDENRLHLDESAIKLRKF